MARSISAAQTCGRGRIAVFKNYQSLAKIVFMVEIDLL